MTAAIRVPLLVYPVPLHPQEAFQDLSHRPGDFPEGEHAARETLAVPVYPKLTPDQQAHVVERIRAFYQA